MAKIPFSKLSLKKKEDIKKVIYNDLEIEIKQYLPVNEKLDLISRVLFGSQDENNFKSPVKVEVVSSLEIIFAYTNLTFTEKQKEDMSKLYDLLSSNGVIDLIIESIPKEEYNFIICGIDETLDAIYNYRNSIYGILDTISKDYSDLELDVNKLAETMKNSENLDLVKNVLTKLG